MTPPCTRHQKRKAEEIVNQVRRAEELGKRFREMSEAGPNNNVTPTFQTVGKIELKEEPDSDPDEGEEVEETFENVEISGNHPQNTSIKVEVEPAGDEESGLASLSTISNATEKERSLADLMNIMLSGEDAKTVKIRQKIVGHLIRDETEKGPSRNDLCSVRLVTKSWLQDASKFLLNCGEPLYKIKVTGPQLLDKFTSTLRSSTSLEAEVPPFSLTLAYPFYREDNHQTFSNFLIEFSSGLVHLDFRFPKNGDFTIFLPLPDVNLKFPNLRKLTIGFPCCRFAKGARLPSASALHFVQFILNGTQKLKDLKFSRGNRASSRLQNSLQFGYLTLRELTLPPTITSLDIDTLNRSWELENLLTFDLPHLHTLTFCISTGKYSDGLISQILEKFRASLQKLIIRDPLTYRRVPPVGEFPTFVRFPLMEELRTLQMITRFVEPEEGHPPLEQVLPNLETLRLSNQTIVKWTKSSTLPNVTTLAVEQVDNSRAPVPSLNLRSTFPSLRSLEVKLAEGPLMEALNQTFQELIQLKELRVIVHNGSVCGTSDHWDSVLTGIPVEVIGGLRKNPEFTQNFQLDNPKLVSIVNLKELESLELSCPPAETGASLTSDLAFQFAFRKMPKLKTLKCGGRFKASAEMEEVWRDSGRIGYFEDVTIC